MNLFDGQFRSRPNINLAGSSSTKSRDLLIAQASAERNKRHQERQRQTAATIIQSLYRSYVIRQRLKLEYHHKFQQLLHQTTTSTTTNPEIRTLISWFVLFYSPNKQEHQAELAQFSQFILRNKQNVITIIHTRNSNTEYALCRFLAIHLRLLDHQQSNNTHLISPSLSLRLIDYFTDPASYTTDMAFVLKFLVNQGFISSLVDYAVAKIPVECQNEHQAPLIYSLAHLLQRTFLLAPHMITYRLCLDLFSKCHIHPQVKALVHKLAQLRVNNLDQFILQLDKELNETPFTSSHFTHQHYSSITYSILTLVLPVLNDMSDSILIPLISVLQSLTKKVLTLDLNFESKAIESTSVLDIEEDMDTETIESGIQEAVFDLLDCKSFVVRLESLLESSMNGEFSTISTSYIIYFMLNKAKQNKMHESNMLRKVAFNKVYLRRLWEEICQLKTNNDIYYLQVLASGNLAKLSQEHLYHIVAPVSTFCSLFNLFLLPILDDEFLNGEAIFSKEKLVKMGSNLKDVCLGIIQLMHPDTAAMTACTNYLGDEPDNLYKNLKDKLPMHNNKEALGKQAMTSTHLFQQCVQTVQRLYTRDIRTGFCDKETWAARSFKLVNLNRISDILQLHGPGILTNVKFGQPSHLFQGGDDFCDNKLNMNDIRTFTVLQEMPFTVSFTDRIQIMETYLSQNDVQRYSVNEKTCRLRIRRDFMYEDAFDNLSLDNCPDMRNCRLVVEMINQHGLEEAGIDGGGVLREFVIGLLESAFDPTRGFFVLTSDGFLYPNPSVETICEDFEAHYFFLGRILGKAIQSKILSPLKFAMFFLQKILISKSRSMDTRLDIDYLVSLDSEVFKNLLYLKDSDKTQDLELNFTLNVDHYGQTKTIELKPGGADIIVNEDNKIEYIHLVADFKLNKQINRQVMAFRNGLSNVVDLELLRLFNFNEFQFLISGSDEVVDVDDWRRHTVYAGAYNEDSQVIINFWQVVQSFDDDQKRKLLKFVTSRSRTPLFGFKNLIPQFAIHSSGSELRLPTASTCMNLLKLPPIEDFETLRNKLVCAIESGSGFELS